MPANSPSPVKVEGANRFADARAAGPIMYGQGGMIQGKVDVSPPQMTRDARQPRAEDERLHLVKGVCDRVQELQQHPAVAVHRAADVGQRDNRAASGFSLAPGNYQRLAAVAHILTQRPPQVDQVAFARGHAAPGAAFCR